MLKRNIPRAPSLARDQRGVAMVEYAILLTLVAVLAVVVFREFGASVLDEVRHATQAIRTLR